VYEGISDSASLALTCRAFDTGTPSTTEFTTGSNGLHTISYAANEQVCVRTRDMDQNLDPGVAETITDTIVSVGGGDREVVTLTETGVNTGVFVACIAASSTVVGAHNDGALYAPSGDLLDVTYVDPTDPNDTSGDVAWVAITGASGPGIAVFKSAALPADGVAVIGEVVRFDLAVINTGDANLPTVTVTDTFPSGCLAYATASLAPDSVTGSQLVWNNIGPLAVGEDRRISLYFTASAACNPATNQATISGVTGGGAVVTDGPVTASVITTDPRVTVEKTLLTAGTATAGDPVSFRITITNSGTTAISTLPLTDNYSDYCLTYDSASPTPDAAGGGIAVWSNLGSLGVGAATSVVINFRARGPCSPAVNTAIVKSALDVNGDYAPLVSDDAELITLALPPDAQLAKTLTAPQTGLAYLGDLVTYTVRIANTGPNALTRLVLTDTWASSCMTLTAWGVYTPTQASAGQATWDTLAPPEPPLRPGESMTLTLAFQTTAVTLACTNAVTLTGLDEFDQPFGPLNSQAAVRVLPAASTVYGHIFEDRDGNGSQNGQEPPLANVSVIITDSVGFTRTVTTDASGAHTATVPAGLTIADVVEATLPTGYIQTAGSDPSSADAPAGGVTSLGDDGYRPTPGAIGDRACVDMDANLLCDDADFGIYGVTLRITGLDVFGARLDITVTTSITGYYRVGDLMPGVYTATAPSSAPGHALVSPSPLATTLTVTRTEDLTLDFAYLAPTGVSVLAFVASFEPAGQAVRVRWTVGGGADVQGFLVYRAAAAEGPYKPVSPAPVLTGPGVADYYYLDAAGVDPRVSYWYKLQALPTGAWFGPIASAPFYQVRVFAPLIGR
jgi:uncharacterized repeat protein (TIGR01451 family)